MQIQDTKTIDLYYKALLEKDEKYIGIYYVGVKTTSIFCISTCRARKPKKENVVFYTHLSEALNHGFRPCKICKPTENSFSTPKEVEFAIKMVKNNLKEKVSDYELKQQNIKPDMVRNWFKKNYGITFHAYQRMLRINLAYLELQEGKSATNAAFDSGYESLSGFGYTFKKILGKSPNKIEITNSIYINKINTPIGPMFIGATDKGICLVEFVDRRMLETEFKDLQKLLHANILIGENKHILQAKKELELYFKGKLELFKVPLDTPGTEFQQQVWLALQSIPFWKIVIYQYQANKINNPKAVRAVASANGFNRVSIIIPCHRVIGKNGELTGYGGGLERKKWLLDHESSMITTQLKMDL